MPAHSTHLPAVVAGLDAHLLVDSAGRHGLSAWLADTLAAARLELPPGAAARLLADARAQIARGQRMKRLTVTVVDALAAQGVTPTLLKGPGLAQRLYPEQPLARPSSDVDVLVQPAELGRARRAMEALGLVEQRDESLADVFEEHHHLSFSRPGALVEVHFRLFSGFGGRTFDEAGLLARRLEGRFEGRAVHWLGPGDEFVYLATHAANHGFLRASWLLDLKRYLAIAEGLDWSTLATRARAAGFHSAVAASLWVLEEALGVECPPPARAAFEVGLLRQWGHRALLSPVHLERADLAAHRLGGFGLRVWLVDSPRDGLRHLALGGQRLLRGVRARWGRNA